MARVVEGRYAVLNEPARVGGLSEVLACSDLEDGGARIALKLLKDLPDRNETLQLLFDREVSALRELKHDNIVRLRDAGIDSDTGRYYLALEWVPNELGNWLKGRDLTPDEVVRQVGLPVLRALAFAHERKIVHRDVKPSNVLVTDEGVPKLADFGISKIKTSLSDNSHTLANYSSYPFAPPESESKSSFSRDVFGFGVFLLACLSKSPVESYDDFAGVLDSLDASLELLDIIESCTSLEVGNRPRSAPELLLRLERLVNREDADGRASLTISLDIKQSTRTKILKEEDLPESEVGSFILRELSDAPSLRPLLGDGEDPVVFADSWFGDTRHFFLYGEEWSFRVVADEREPRLAIISCARVGAVENDSRRDRHLVLDDIRFTVDAPLNYDSARSDVRALVERAFAHEGMRHGERTAQERARLFDQWSKQLDAREAVEEEREDRISVRFKSQNGYRLTLSLVDEAIEDVAGLQRALLDDRGRFVARGTIDAVQDGEVVLYVERLPSRTVPHVGYLALDMGASRVKLNREREALARVRFGASGLVNVSLPDLVLQPAEATEIQPALIDEWAQPDLDEHKRAAVAQALASEDFVVVHGPPGTGKTTFIAELAAQLFRRTPGARVLLASQTHVAVDNALMQIRKVSPDLRMVRVGRRAQETMAADVLDLAIEVQLERWREEVRERSKAYLERLVADHGVDVSTVRKSMRIAELVDLLRRISLCDAGISRRIEQLSAGAHEEGAAAEDAQADLEAEIEKLRDGRDLTSRRAQLVADDPLIAELVGSRDLSELRVPDLVAAGEALLPAGADETGINLKQVVDAQAKWLDRIGSGTEFEAALVVASQMVAGTCVGIAGAPGIDDEEFDLCIVDEASKATATETLVPLVRAKRWVLVGDEKQLPPFLDEALRDKSVQDEFSLDPAELKQTLFGRLARGLPAANSRSLNRQYRMVPQIGDLISACFYGGTLESADRQPLSLTTELQGSPVCWLATDGLRDHGERETETKTFLNLCEAREVMKHLKRLDALASRDPAGTLHVLVLAPYSAQVSELGRRVRQERERLPHLEVEVNTVDAAQGREADALVFSTVRSNPRFKMGFVRDLERANVALSRGKYLLTIVGDSSFFEQAGGPLGDVLRYVRQHPSTCTVRELSSDGS